MEETEDRKKEQERKRAGWREARDPVVEHICSVNFFINVYKFNKERKHCHKTAGAF